jgi:hypothetical protein
MLTSGSDISAAVVAVAVVGSSHPANSGDIAASINAMHAGCARKPDIETVAPDADVDANNIRARAISTDIAFDDGNKIERAYCIATRFVAAQCHTMLSN